MEIVKNDESGRTYLTADETAVLLRTSRKAIYSMIERGQLPVTRLGRRVLIHRQRLVNFLDHNCTPSLKEKKR